MAAQTRVDGLTGLGDLSKRTLKIAVGEHPPRVVQDHHRRSGVDIQPPREGETGSERLDGVHQDRGPRLLQRFGGKAEGCQRFLSIGPLAVAEFPFKDGQRRAVTFDLYCLASQFFDAHRNR